jgi:hypothetical protein
VFLIVPRDSFTSILVIHFMHYPMNVDSSCCRYERRGVTTIRSRWFEKKKTVQLRDDCDYKKYTLSHKSMLSEQ